jgi:hypothetical protein
LDYYFFLFEICDIGLKMILPTKTIQPVDSLISISALIIEILKEKDMTLDDLYDEFNKRYYKKITIEKLILSIDFYT